MPPKIGSRHGPDAKRVVADVRLMEMLRAKASRPGSLYGYRIGGETVLGSSWVSAKALFVKNGVDPQEVLAGMILKLIEEFLISSAKEPLVKVVGK